jgi:hypothetical protein
LAQNSIIEKQVERYNNTLLAYEEFTDQYTESSKFMKEAKEIEQKSRLALKKLEDKKS